MNLESSAWRQQAGEPDEVERLIIVRRRRIRIAAIVGGVLVVLLILFMVMGHGKQAPAGGDAKQNAAEIPQVTVIIPGRSQITRTITATGSLAARRDMPVGISGDGGQVARVLVDAGAWVRAGQTLAVIERSVQAQQAQQLAASIDVARADAALAQQELDRGQALVNRGFISKADIQKLTATRDAANARVRVAQAQYRETLARIGKLDVRAPTDGLILSRNVEVGQVVSPGSGALFHMAEKGEMELLAKLSQEDLARVTAGTPVKVTPVGSTRSYEGRIRLIDPIIDPENRQGDARVSVPYNLELRPGGFATAQIDVGSVDAPLLPESAVLNDGDGNYVYVVGPDNKIARRNIRIGTVNDQGVAIADGLAGNERVVLAAGAFLNPGDKVNPRRSAAH